MDSEGRHYSPQPDTDSTDWSGDSTFDNSSPKNERRLPPPLPEAARAKFKGIHAEPEDKVLFDPAEISPRKMKHERPHDEVLFDDTEFAHTPQKTWRH